MLCQGVLSATILSLPGSVSLYFSPVIGLLMVPPDPEEGTP